MVIKDKVLKQIIIGAAFLWIGIGIWGIYGCLQTAKLLKQTQMAQMGITQNLDATPYLFANGLSVPYIVFATAIASSVFVIFTLFMADNHKKRHEHKSKSSH